MNNPAAVWQGSRGRSAWTIVRDPASLHMSMTRLEEVHPMKTAAWLTRVLVLMVVFSVSAEGANLLRIKEGHFHKPGRFPAWCVDLGHWRRLPAHQETLQLHLQPLAAQGVNTIAIHLDDPKDRFFAPDGTLRKAGSGKDFKWLAVGIRDHYMGCVVSLFSAKPELWLEDAEAYERAVTELMKAIQDRYSMVFYIGDLHHDGPWPRQAPCDLDDPELVFRLARKIREVKEDALVAIPARLVPGNVGDTLLYASDNPDSLRKWMTSPSPYEHFTPKRTNTVVLPRERVQLCGEDAKAKGPQFPCTKSTQAFLDRVEEVRLALQADRMPTSKHEPARLSDRERKEGFELLFNGQDLSGWTTLTSHWGGWTVRDGTIHCDGISGPWLMTRKRYASFILRLEFKIEQKGNSGIFLRASLDGRCSRFGMEMQIRGINFTPTHKDATGAIYDVRAPKVDATRPPGEWNAAEIACRGDQVTIRINDQLVQEFTMSEDPKLARRLRRGVIGLQDHNDKVWFRNLRIKNLEP